MFVYILRNRVGKIYIGQTNDLVRRMEEHNVTGVNYTSKHRPWALIYSEAYDKRSDAMRREKFFKTGAGRDWIKKNILHA